MAEGEATTNKSIRDVDATLWRWLRAQAVAEGKTIGEKLNEILTDACEAQRHEPNH